MPRTENENDNENRDIDSFQRWQSFFKINSSAVRYLGMFFYDCSWAAPGPLSADLPPPCIESKIVHNVEDT